MLANAVLAMGPADERAFHDAILRTDLAVFVRKAFGTVCPGTPFVPNWHLDALCNALTKVTMGETRRLIIEIPPRHLKSICASVALPAWLLGQDPTRQIISVCYAKDLAIKHANDCRAVMNSDWYRRVFPGTRLDPSKNTETEVMTTKRGFRMSTSVHGTLTGRGASLIIIDDPIKPADAMSAAVRERVNEWCSSTLFSRLNDKRHDAIILVMQRLHVNDLAGHLLPQGGWEHLSLPAIAESDERIETGPGQYHIRRSGELLHPARESADVLDRIKKEMGSAAFAAQYQQSPVPPGGNMIKWNWFGWYDKKENLNYDDIIVSWDTAMKPTELSDYSVATIWGKKGDFYYLLELIRLHLAYPELRRKVKEIYSGWLEPTILIEDAGSGTSLIQDLRAENIPVIGIKPKGDKVMRMNAQLARLEAGAVHLPLNAPWLGDFKTEVLAFPDGAHDDQVDSMCQALSWMSRPRRRLLAVGA